jgi:hypothetical protein
MAPSLGLGMVLIGLAGVEDLGVGQQLDVARFELHLDVKLRIVGDGFDEVQRFELAVSQARHLRMTLGITNVPTDEENTGRAAYVIEHGQREERVFAW